MVTPAARTLVGVRALVIEPRVMQVMVALHRQLGEVVGREALIEACWDGRTVGEDAINRAILKLRRALEETGGNLTVETVAKVGYRLCEGQSAVVGEQIPSGTALTRPSWYRWFAIGCAVVAIAGGELLLRSRYAEPTPTRIVVVQPLQVAASDVLARRLAQDFTSDLSRAVLGHDSRLEFADGQGATGQKTAFTVTGTVDSAGKDLHAVIVVNKRDDRSILWSHDYTAPLNDASGLRQQIGTNVAAVLGCNDILGIPNRE